MNKLYGGFIVLLFAMSARGQSMGSYQLLTQALRRQNHVVNSHRPLLVFLYNKASCASCNVVVERVFNTASLQRQLSARNFLVLSPSVRTAEIPQYRQRFAYLHPLPPYVADSRLYHTLLRQLRGPQPEAGGFVIVCPDNRIRCAVSLKAANAEQQLAGGR